MRRAFLAILGAIATTAALISGKYFVTAPASVEHAEPDIPGLHDTTGGDDPSASESPSQSASASPSPSTSPQQSQSTTPNPAGKKSTPPVRTTAPPAGGNGQTTKPPPTCKSYDGDNAWVGEIGEYGTVYVSIKVCDGVLTEASGGIMMSNYEPTNSTAVAAMHQLAVQYYKTNISMITYSGATATAAAYRASLQSAMSRAGI